MVQSAERQEKAAELGITVTDKQVETRLDQAEEAVLRRQREEVPGPAEGPGPHRRRSCATTSRTQLVQEKLFAKVTKNVTVSRRGRRRLLRREPDDAVHDARVTRPAPHPRRSQRRSRASIYKQLEAGTTRPGARSRRSTREDPVVQGQVRQAHGDARVETVPGLRQGRLLAADEEGARAGLRLGAVQGVLHHRAADADQARQDDAREEGRGVDQAALLTHEEERQSMTDLGRPRPTKSFCSGKQVVYQVGYAPSPDPCATLTSSTATNNTTT